MKIASTATLRERFEHFVTRPEDPDACWGWAGACLPTGYGMIWTGSGRSYAHRVSFELHFGPIPDGMFVCHTCDNPPCSNPKHLWLGTAGDNTHDAVIKGRLHVPSYSDAFVADIRARHAEGMSTVALSRETGIARQTIYRWVSGRRRAVTV